jgi:hypothetical protein
VEDLEIQDIAQALSNQCRFSGHTSEFYSVAQHSVHVSNLCDKADALWGLLHDASEAYLVDVPRPVKRASMMDGYRKAESVLMDAICQRFGLSGLMPDSVHRADNEALIAEAKSLMGNPDWAYGQYREVRTVPPMMPLPPKAAKRLFLDRYYELKWEATLGANRGDEVRPEERNAPTHGPDTTSNDVGIGEFVWCGGAQVRGQELGEGDQVRQGLCSSNQAPPKVLEGRTDGPGDGRPSSHCGDLEPDGFAPLR